MQLSNRIIVLHFILKESIVFVGKYTEVFVFGNTAADTAFFNESIWKYKVSYLQAKYNGVAPDTFGLLISAPLSSKHCTVWGGENN